MTKKRIFIQMHYLELGGAEKALLGLLDAIDKDRYQIDLFLNQHTGSFMSQIPTGVNLLREIPEYAAMERPFAYTVKHCLWRSLLRRIQRNLKFKNYLRRKPGYESMASHIYLDTEIKSLPSLYDFGEYDLAISFLDPPHIVQDKVRARTKVEWIHTDFSAIKYDSERAYERWSKNDYIISISDAVTESFKKLYPSLSAKIVLIENIISSSFVRKQSVLCEGVRRTDDLLVLCSIGRINAEPKNFKSIPAIAAILKERELKFYWQIIGPGEEGSLREAIAYYGVESEVVIMGPRSNPYPYVANCDIYVQPSLYEGKSIAVREAQILCKPVIITNYPTARSQVIDGVDGIICNMDNDSIANAIIELANDQKKRNALSDYLSTHDYGLMDEVEKLYSLV